MTIEMQKWYFGGIDLTTLAWSVAEVPGGIGVPPKRGSNLNVPYAYGERQRVKSFGPRVVPLGIWVRGFDPITGMVPAGKTERQALLENMDYLSGILTTRTQAKLRRVFTDTTTIREAMAEVLNEVKLVRSAKGLLARGVIDFWLADPFFYGLAQTSATTDIDSNPESWTHTNPGTAPAIKMTITMTGPLDAPKLENLTNGIWIQYNGAIANGEAVVIDTAAFTMYKGVDNMISALRHQGAPQWFILERGANSLRVTCDSAPSGSVRIQYYPAYS
jgi:phage-related protein